MFKATEFISTNGQRFHAGLNGKTEVKLENLFLREYPAVPGKLIGIHLEHLRTPSYPIEMVSIHVKVHDES